MDRLQFALTISIPLLATLNGCASPFVLDDGDDRARPRTLLTADLPMCVAPAGPDIRPPTVGMATIPDGAITLRDALHAALSANPDLVAGAWRTRIEEVRELDAALRPNPELELEFENFAGSGDFSGTDALETNLRISQLIELGDDRERRMELAGRAWDVAAWEYEGRRLEVATETAKRFIVVLTRQRQVELAERSHRLAEESRQVIARRVELGDASSIDELKARLLAESRRIEADRALNVLDSARADLAAMWGAARATFDSVEGDLAELMSAPQLDELTAAVEQHPDVQRWAAEMTRRQADVALQRAKSKADLTVSAGPRFNNENDDVAALLGFSMPLQIFDANQGGILEARLAVSEAAAERRAAASRLAAQLTRAHARLTTAYHEAAAIRNDLLPTAQRAFESTRTAYDAGELAYLDVLDAQRTLFETESQLLEALGDYHAASAEVEGIIARPLHESPQPEPTRADEGANED